MREDSDRPDSGERGELVRLARGHLPATQGFGPWTWEEAAEDIVDDILSRLRTGAGEETHRFQSLEEVREAYLHDPVLYNFVHHMIDSLLRDHPDPSTRSEGDDVEDEAWDWPESKVKAHMYGLFARLEKCRPAIRARTVHALASTWCMTCGETFDICDCDATPTGSGDEEPVWAVVGHDKRDGTTVVRVFDSKQLAEGRANSIVGSFDRVEVQSTWRLRLRSTSKAEDDSDALSIAYHQGYIDGRRASEGGREAVEHGFRWGYEAGFEDGRHDVVEGGGHSVGSAWKIEGEDCIAALDAEGE